MSHLDKERENLIHFFSLFGYRYLCVYLTGGFEHLANYSFSSNLRNFWFYFFRYSICFSLFLLFFWDSRYAYVGILSGVLQVSEALPFFSHSFYFLFIRLDNLNGPVFKFFDLVSYILPLLLSFFKAFFISVILFSKQEFLFGTF